MMPKGRPAPPLSLLDDGLANRTPWVLALRHRGQIDRISLAAYSRPEPHDAALGLGAVAKIGRTVLYVCMTLDARKMDKAADNFTQAS